MEERLRHTEWQRMLGLSAFLSELAYFDEEMQGRMSMIEDGPARLKSLIETSTEFMRDLLKTVPDAQKRKLSNTFRDYKITLVPMLSPASSNVLLLKEEAMALVDYAQEKCKYCLDTSEDSEFCPLRKILETVTPLSKYDTMLCPYNLAEWKE